MKNKTNEEAWGAVETLFTKDLSAFGTAAILVDPQASRMYTSIAVDAIYEFTDTLQQMADEEEGR